MSAEGFISFQFKTFNRRENYLDSAGRERTRRCSLIGKVAYQRGEKLWDELLRRSHNYLDKAPGVLAKALVGYKGAPRRFRDRLKFWNMVNRGETRKNAKLGHLLIISCDHRMARRDQFRCILQLAREMANYYRTFVDAAHHAPNPADGHDQRNDHAHLLMPRRQITADGYSDDNPSFAELDDIKQAAAAIYRWRVRYCTIQNEMFARRGLDIVIDPRSYEERGIEKIPGIHRGPAGQAMEERGVRPESKVQLDARGNLIDFPKIDEGQTRSEFNGNIDALNIDREIFGPEPLAEQIHDLTRKIEILIHRITDLGSVIPEAMLPPWARKMLHAMQALVERLAMQKAEAERRAEEREEEEKKREGLHERMRRMQSELREMREVLARRQALQGFYMRLQLVVASMPPIKADIEPPRRVISNRQYNVELHFKAETARAQVPPEYRPRIERPPVSLPDTKTGQGSFNAAVIKPPDNGGRARPPPPLTRNFNAQADPQPEPYKAKVKVGFGPK